MCKGGISVIDIDLIAAHIQIALRIVRKLDWDAHHVLKLREKGVTHTSFFHLQCHDVYNCAGAEMKA